MAETSERDSRSGDGAEVPDLSPPLREIVDTLNRGALPDPSELERLFDAECPALEIREQVDYWVQVRFDLENSKVQQERFNKLLVASLLVPGDERFERLLKHHLSIEYSHYRTQRSAGVSKDDLYLVTEERAFKFFNILFQRDLSTVSAERLPALLERLDVLRARFVR